MWHDTTLTRLLGIRYPLIQAPMAAATTPALVAAVARSGGLGSLGAGYLTPEQLRKAVQDIRALTDRPFAVNLFIAERAQASAEQLARARALLEPYRAELGLASDGGEPWTPPSFEQQLAVVFEERVPIFSFTFGLPSPALLRRLREAGTVVMGTATTAREAVALDEAGVDAIVAQGSEAGGHRGAFLAPAADPLIGTMALVPQVVDRVRRPVVAAGGIMDGRGLAAALMLGAAGVQMGTAFLRCSESGAPASYQEALRASTDESTVLTRAFSGRPARGLKNRFIAEMAPHEGELPPYPVQHGLTRELRQAAAAQGRAELLALFAGQASPLGRDVSAETLVAEVVAQAQGLLGRAWA